MRSKFTHYKEHRVSKCVALIKEESRAWSFIRSCTVRHNSRKSLLKLLPNKGADTTPEPCWHKESGIMNITSSLKEHYKTTSSSDQTNKAMPWEAQIRRRRKQKKELMAHKCCWCNHTKPAYENICTYSVFSGRLLCLLWGTFKTWSLGPWKLLQN